MAGLTYKLKLDWDRWNQQHNMQKLMERVKPQAPESTAIDVQPVRTAIPAAELSYISDNNLFHKDRNMNLPKDEDKAKAVIRLDNPPEIMGVVVIEGRKYIQARSSKGGGEGNRAVQLGEGDKWESIWQLDSILDDRIVLVSGEAREEVLFHDPGKRRVQKAPGPSQAKGKSAILTIGGSSGSSSSSRPATASAAADVTPPKTTSASVSSPTTERSRTSSTRDFLNRRSSSSQPGNRTGATSTNSAQRSSFFRAGQRRPN
ncbi:MAG TPA: hypothetical protein PLY66_07325 [Acidobacteriota bacterium]|nr:hypothetical protein [Acidobacteriota bacterium]HQF85898.1 hypothetical protein [Acidobacteriota bacterium]